jgi:hypothetical protein
LSLAADITTAYLKETQDDLIKSYESKGLKASGKYAKGLIFRVEDTGKSIKAFIESEGYVQFMQSGRSPNKNKTAKQARSLGKILEKWVADKGITVNPYAAAWKIVREGIKVPNQYNPGGVVDDILTKEWFDGLVKKLGEQQIIVIQQEVTRLFMK